MTTSSWTDHLEKYASVALAIFKYAALLRSSPPSKTTFDEISRIGNISFRFAERGKVDHYCTNLSGWLASPVPREKIVSTRYLLEQYNPDELSAAMQLLDPRKAAIGVTCKELPKDVTGTWDQTEPIYGTQYRQQKLSEEFIKEVSSGIQWSAQVRQ